MKKKIFWVILGIAMLLASTYYVLFQLGASMPPAPKLSAEIERGTLVAGGIERSFEYFAPHDRMASPGLVLAFHTMGAMASR